MVAEGSLRLICEVGARDPFEHPSPDMPAGATEREPPDRTAGPGVGAEKTRKVGAKARKSIIFRVMKWRDLLDLRDFSLWRPVALEPVEHGDAATAGRDRRRRRIELGQRNHAA